MEEQSARWRGMMGVLALAVMVAAVSGAFAGASVALLIPREESKSTAVVAPDTGGPSSVVKVTEESGTTDTFKKVAPSVVTLLVQAQHVDSLGRQIQETNLGSGVVIDDRGYIVTNQHVVDGARKITVKLSSGEERPGVLVGDDAPFTDLAVVRVQPDGLPAVKIGDSDALVHGQQVLAIGSVAFSAGTTDFRNNITRGIISGLHRRWPRDDTVMEDLIQTDAAVNHGNSGGALVTLSGELVGITTTVVRGNQGGQTVEGVAFALPSKTFKPIVDQIIANGKTERPYVGVVHKQLTPELAQQSRLTVQAGAYVLDVLADSPAARAGIQRGDVITKLNDLEINQELPYLNALVKQQPGTSVPVSLIRAGRPVQVNMDIVTR